MKNSCTQDRKDAGFTLVELAIVMIIIGLLIGGILKGQELINNARVASTIAQVKGITAATNTFRDQFRMLPGDMPNAQAVARLPNCAAAPCNNGGGNGNNQIGANNSANAVVAAGENLSFWSHLNAADMLTGVDGTATIAWGNGLPAAEVGGGFVVGYDANPADGVGVSAAATGRGGNYIALRSTPTVAGVGNAVAPSQALRMDLKLDDGAPLSGSVIGSGAGVTCAATAATYATADALTCDVFIRM